MIMPNDISSTPLAIGKVILDFQGKTYESGIARYNPTWLHSDHLTYPDNPNPTFDRNGFLASFLPDTGSGPFDQLFNRGSTNHRYLWGLVIDNINYQAETGIMKGVIQPGWTEVKADITMNFGNGLVAKISFEGRPR